MIVRMKHLDLVCVASDRERTLEQLRALGAVHLDLNSAAGAAVQDVKGELADAERAVRLILKARGKETNLEIRPRTVAEVLALESDRATLLAEKERLEREIKVYEPYGDFDPELAKKLLDRGIDLTDELPAKLPAMRLGKMREKLARVENRMAVDTAKMAAADEKVILAEYPEIQARLAFEQAKELMAEKGALAVVSGWIPETGIADLKSQISENGWGMLVRDPAEG